MTVGHTEKQILTANITIATWKWEKYLDKHDFLPAKMELHVYFNLHYELVDEPNDQDYRYANLDNAAIISARIPYARTITAVCQTCHRISHQPLLHLYYKVTNQFQHYQIIYWKTSFTYFNEELTRQNRQIFKLRLFKTCFWF